MSSNTFDSIVNKCWKKKVKKIIAKNTSNRDDITIFFAKYEDELGNKVAQRFQRRGQELAQFRSQSRTFLGSFHNISQWRQYLRWVAIIAMFLASCERYTIESWVLPAAVHICELIAQTWQAL